LLLHRGCGKWRDGAGLKVYALLHPARLAVLLPGAVAQEVEWEAVEAVEVLLPVP
jgi:hypothetical protein